MNCVICKYNEVSEGLTTVVLTRGNSVVIIREVPAQICKNCGEYYLSSEMTKKVYAIASEAVKKGAEVEIIKFAA